MTVLTQKQAREHKRALERDIKKDHRNKAHAKLKELSVKLRHAYTQK